MHKNILNICVGRELKKNLQTEVGKWISFNEKRIEDNYKYPLFSDEFCIDRCKKLNVSLEEYIDEMKEFINELSKLNEYDCITLWYRDDPSSINNAFFIYDCLKEYGYDGNIVSNELDKHTLQVNMRVSNF